MMTTPDGAAEGPARGVPHHDRPDVVVVGAGISGLTAGFRLHQQGYSVTVLEAADAVGGKMASYERDGYVLNRGAAMIPAAFGNLIELTAESGLGNPFEPLPLSFGIPRGGRMRAFGGSGIGALLRTVFTPLLSWRSKLLVPRLFADVSKYGKLLGHSDWEAEATYDTESIAQYVDRRLNREVYDYLIDPILRGTYLDETPDMSVVDLFLTFGKFAEGGPMTLPKGIDFLAKQLASHLDVRTGAAVTRVIRTEAGVETTWQDARGEHMIVSRGAVVASSAAETLRIVPDLTARQRELIQSIGYGGILKGIFGLRRLSDDVPTLTSVPRAAGVGLGIVIIDTRLTPDAAPDGKVIVSGHWTDGYLKANAGRSDEEVLPEMIQHMESVIPGFAQDLEFAEVVRWDIATNTRRVGFYQTVGELQRSFGPDDAVQLAGDFLAISGSNSASESGARAAARLDAAFTASA